VPRPDSLVLMVSVLLASAGALAQPQGAKPWKRVERSVSLDAGAEEATQALRLAPNVVTTILFNSDIDVKAVDVENLRALFSRVEVQPQLLVLRPAVAMPAKGVPPLVVRFADASAPQRLVFVLTTEQSEVDSVVDVLRQPVPAEELEAQLVALRSHCEELEARLAAVRKQALPRGLAGAILSGAIEEAGVTRQEEANLPISRGLLALKLDSYRSRQWLAFSMKLENPAGSSPWVPGLARLTRLDSEGRPLGGVLEAPVQLREARLAPGQSALAVAQWPLSADDGAAAYALEVLDAAGRRGVRWPQVVR
jgi:uncharacterized protein (TIGR02268 family)